MDGPILIVDDSALIRHVLAGMLSRLGIPTEDILQAASGAEAIVLAKRKLPSIVFSDLWMPNMDGLTFLQQMKADSQLKQIPIIVVTANAQQESVVAAHRLGAAGFLRKPIREKCLARELKKRLPGAKPEETGGSCQE